MRELGPSRAAGVRTTSRAVPQRSEPLAGVPGLEPALAEAGDGAFAIGDDGRIVLWNPSAERIMGHTGRDVLGRLCCEVFTGYDEHGNRLCYQGCHVMSLVRLRETVHSFDMRTRTKSGQPIWINISILTIEREDRAPVTIHLFRDVTATKELLTLVHERLTAGADGVEATTLSRRELEVLRLMTDGLDTRAVAERLHVSRATVRNHAQHIFDKLGVHSRLEAVAYATRHRLF
jgi:PAS domain S-box-containing protein